MYGGHRGAIPNTTPAQRIAEHLEALKNEFETLENDSGVYKMQRDDLERKLEAQLNEFHTMRQTLIELERKHQKIKQQYEEEILRLRRLLEAATSNNNSIADGKGLPGQTGLLGQGPGGPSGKEGEAPFFPSQAGGGATVFPPLVPSHKGYNDLNKGDKRPETKRDFAPLPGSQQANGKHGVPSFGEIERGNEDTAAPAAGVSSSAATPAPRVGTKPPPPPQQQQHALAMMDQSMMENNKPDHSGLPPGMEPSIQNLQGRADVGKTDWVVVYNPSVKTNVNINLLHNLDHQSVVCCVKFSQNGKYLATGCNKVAKIYDVETGEKVCSFPDDSALANSPMGSVEKEDSYVRSVCFSPDGQYLVAGAEDRTVKVWDIKSRTQRHSFQGHELDIYSLDFAPDGRYVVSGSGDGKAKIWNMKTGECMYTLGNEEVGPKEGVTSVAVSPDGRLVAAGSLDCVVRLWDAHTGQFLDSFKGHDDSVYSVAFSPDGKTLASGSLDKTLKIWDLASRPDRCISTLTGHRDYVLSVAFSPDGNWLISGSKDRSVQFWDPRSSILHLMLQGHKNSVISVALNPTMQMFATGSGDFRARIWKYSL